MWKGQGQGDSQCEDHGAGFGQGIKDTLAICGTYCALITLVVIVLALIGLGIAKIVMGAIYINDCPIQYLIPIWLIVSGCAPTLLAFLSNVIPSNDVHCETEGPTTQQNTCTYIYTQLGAIGTLFNFAWLICGTVWIAPIYFTVTDGCPGSTSCCNATLMDFALAMLIIDWVIIGLITVMSVVLYYALCLNFCF